MDDKKREMMIALQEHIEQWMQDYGVERPEVITSLGVAACRGLLAIGHDDDTACSFMAKITCAAINEWHEDVQDAEIVAEYPALRLVPLNPGEGNN